MKTITGKIISSKPISLSKAASTISTFILAETGASKAVSTYLKQSSDSFNEIVKFHRDQKNGDEKRTKKQKKKKKRTEETEEDGEVVDSEISMRKRKRRTEA